MTSSGIFSSGGACSQAVSQAAFLLIFLSICSIIPAEHLHFDSSGDVRPTRAPPPRVAAAPRVNIRELMTKIRQSGGRNEKMLVCACCNVQSSSEKAYIVHIKGNKHYGMSSGRGFCGLAPNSHGLVPPLADIQLRAAAKLFGHPPDGFAGEQKERGPWTPPTNHVNINPLLSTLVTDALHATRHLHPPSAPNSSSSSQPARAARAPRPNHVPPPPPLLTGGGPLGSVRRALPVYKFRGAVLEALREPASLVEGETGSGKTTQVRT